MANGINEVFFSLIALSIILILFVLFLITFALLFQRRQAQFRAEKQAMLENYQREILQAQIETQNQTLQHVSEELHDHIGQVLSVVVLQLNGLDDDLASTPHQADVQQASSLVGQVLMDLRSLSKTLNSDALKRIGFYDSIALELERIERTRRFKTKLLKTGELPRMDKQVEVVVLRMVQEALSNAIKHARARTLTVSLEASAQGMYVRVADDGRGLAQKPEQSTGSGYHNMQRRAALLGGHCKWNGSLNQGTTVEIFLPLTVFS